MISIYQFSQSTAFTKHVFSNSYSEKIWNYAINQITDPDYDSVPDNVSPQRTLQLLANRGCEECGKNRIRKVYWPFAKRLCHKCLTQLTISNYRLTTDYNIPVKYWPDNYQERSLWNKYFGNYNLQFYLISEVEANLGKTLKQIDDEKNAEQKRRDNLAIELSKWAQKEFSNRSRILKCRKYSEVLEQISTGNILNISRILTKDFISELSEEYKKLKNSDKESARHQRQQKKLYRQLWNRISQCITRDDFSRLSHDVHVSSLPIRQKYMIDGEIWSRGRQAPPVPPE